jgi:ABC-type antimicrobial peptide transport system permease subunit
VSQRRREIGLRMALGARPGQIRWQFLTLAARLLMTGSVLGVIGSWITGRAMQAMLFHTPALPLTVALGVAVGMGAVCLAACLIPSIRAARISPAHVLAEP